MKLSKILFITSLFLILSLTFLVEATEKELEGTISSIDYSNNKIIIYLEEGTQLVIFDDKILHLKKGDKILFIGKKEVYRRTEQIIVDKIILK